MKADQKKRTGIFNATWHQAEIRFIVQSLSQACPYGAIVYVWWIDHTCVCLWHTTLSEPAEGTLLTPCAFVCMCGCVICLYVSKLVWTCLCEGENECVFVPLRAWQCPQWCHPERFSSSSAMTKMSNDTHIRSHPHHTYRSSHLCCGSWALWDPAGEEEWEMTLRSSTMCLPLIFFSPHIFLT